MKHGRKLNDNHSPVLISSLPQDTILAVLAIKICGLYEGCLHRVTVA